MWEWLKKFLTPRPDAAGRTSDSGSSWRDTRSVPGDDGRDSGWASEDCGDDSSSSDSSGDSGGDSGGGGDGGGGSD